MALMSGQLHSHPNIFHALIVLLSGLYLTGIPVFELLQGQQGWFPYECFPLYSDPNMFNIRVETLSDKHFHTVCFILRTQS